MRVRGFTVDDAHLFCAPEQVKDEVAAVSISRQGFQDVRFREFKVELSVRGRRDNSKVISVPTRIGTGRRIAGQALSERGFPTNASKAKPRSTARRSISRSRTRSDACGSSGRSSSISICRDDFELEYTGEDNQKHQPIMIHRALFGSIERFFGVLIEHYAGAFPLWLAPVQVAVLPITGPNQRDTPEKVEQ